MSDSNNENISQQNTRNSSSDAQSPTPSSPIEIRSKRRRQELQAPRILPFSDHNDTSNEDRPETAVEYDNSERSDEPVIRGSLKTEELQLRLFQLKMDMKNVQDELRRRIPDIEGTSEADDTYDETYEDMRDLGASSDSSVYARRGNSSTPPWHAPHDIESSPRHRDLDSENARLKEEIERLQRDLQHARVPLQAASLQAEAAEDGTHKRDTEESTLRTSIKVRDEIIKKLQETQEFQSRALTAEKSRVSLLHESRNNLASELNRLRDEYKLLKEHSSHETPTSSGKPRSATTIDEATLMRELNKVEAELERTILQKNQISDMLMDERNLYVDLQEAAAQLNAETSSREVSLTSSIENLTSQIEKLEQEKTDLSKTNEKLQSKITSQDESLTNLRDNNKELEKRIEQQLAENSQLARSVESRDETIEQNIRELAKRQNQMNSLNSELENRNNDVATLDLKFKNLTLAYDGCQSDLNEARTSIESKDSKIKILKTEVRDKRRENDNLKEELKELRSASASFQDVKQSEIDQLQADIKSSRKTIENLKEQHQRTIDDLTRTHSLHMDQSSKDAKARLSESQNSLSTQILKIADMKRELIEKSDRVSQLIAENRTLLVKIQSQERKISDLEVSIQKRESDDYETINKLRELDESVKAKTFELKNRSHVEDALSEKVQQLEKVVSDQTLKLNTVASVNINDLQRRADEGAKAIEDLTALRREYNSNYSEWLSYQESTERKLKELSNNNGALETELNNLRTTQDQREQQFRESVLAGHESQLNYLRDEYNYNFSSLKTAYDSLSSDLAVTRNEKGTLLNSIHDMEAKLNAYLAQIKDVQTQLEIAESGHKRLSSQVEDLSSQKAALTANIEKLSISLEESQSSSQSREREISKLRDDLNRAVELADKRALDLEDRAQELLKLNNHFNDISTNLFRIMAFSYHQIKSLEFIKKIYSTSFPRFDIVPFAAPKPRNPMQSLRVAILTVLAVVKFKDAGKRGIKREAISSEDYVRKFY